MAFIKHARDRRSRAIRPPRALAAAVTTALAAGLLAGVTVPAHAAAGPVAPAGLKQAPTVDPKIIAAQNDATAKAKSSKQGVVVDAMTTENTQTIANPDGSFTLNQSAGPVRAKKDNAWVPVDTKLAKRPDGSYAPGATDADVSFSAGGSGPLVTMVREGKKVSLTWPTALPAPTVDGDTATYPNVLPDVDLAVTAHADGFSQVLVVKTAQAAANPALASLHIATATDGVTLSQTGIGDAEAKDADGKTVFRADPPLVWDSATNAQPVPGSTPAAPSDPALHHPKAAKAQAAPQEQSVASGADAAEPKTSDHRGPGSGAHVARIALAVDKSGLTLAPDQQLLKGKDTKLPLYIDPAWSGNPSVVSWVSLNSGGWKATTGNEAHVGFLGTWGGCGSYCNTVARTYFQMNVSGFQGAAKVTQAILRPYFTWAADSNAEPTQVWVDSYLPGDWGSKPGSGSSNFVKEVSSCIGHYTASGCGQGTVDFDVTSMAQGAANGGWQDFEIDATDEGNQYQWKKIDPTQSNWSVTFYKNPGINNTCNGCMQTSPAVTAFGGTYLNTNTVNMSVTGSGVGENIQVDYEVWTWVNGNATNKVGAVWSNNGFTSWGGPGSYGGLADGNYAWHAAVHGQDSDLWSGWSQWIPFTVETAVPPTPDTWSPQFPEMQYGGAYQDNGTFTFTNYTKGHIAGYIFSLDADLGSTNWSQQTQPPTWSAGQVITRGQQYWLPWTGTMNPVTFAIPTVGPHFVYVKAVGYSGLISAERSYGFWAGMTTPVYVSGDQLANGYTATNDDKTTTAVPAATSTGAGHVISQGGWWQTHWYSGSQGMLANSSSTATVAVTDTATFNFDVPHTGYWALGANLTKASDYGQYTMVLDKGTATQFTLIPSTAAFDGYYASPDIATGYRDFGIPKDGSGNAIQLNQGVHTLTLTITGKNGSSAGYQAGIDVLRLNPMSATCPITDLTACRNNIAISPDSNHLAADADAVSNSFSGGELTRDGWTPGIPITINGALMNVPNYAQGKADNILSSGQTITVDNTTYANNSGNAVVFLAFATDGNINAGLTGTITYGTKADGVTSQCGLTTSHPYSMDMVPDWSSGAPGSHAVGFTTRNTGAGTDGAAPQLFPISVKLPCPGVPIKSITLPVVTNRLTYGTAALHIMGVGIRQSSYVGGSTSAANWNGTWGVQQDVNASGLTTQTVRIPARITVGNNTGGQVRIHLSNALGTTAVTFPHVSIAPQAAAGGAAAAATPTAVTFNNNNASVTLPAGGEIVSDPINLNAAAQSTLLVSLQVDGSVSGPSAHSAANATIYASAANSGDHTGDTAADAYTATLPNIPYLTGVDVTPANGTVGALALYGDQTVNSDSTTPDNAHRLSDLIYSDVTAAYDGITNPAPYGVLNFGRNSGSQAGNLMPGLSGSSTQLTPTSSTNPVDRTVLDAANVHEVLISTGASDIQQDVANNMQAGPAATDVENKLMALVQQIKQRNQDKPGGVPITVYVATIPAWVGLTAGSTQDTVRRQVNNFLLCGRQDPGAGDCTTAGPFPNGVGAQGVINFAAAVAVDHTDTGLLNTARDTYTDASNNVYPNQTYFQDLADEYTKSSTNSSGYGGVGVSPN